MILLHSKKSNDTFFEAQGEKKNFITDKNIKNRERKNFLSRGKNFCVLMLSKMKSFLRKEKISVDFLVFRKNAIEEEDIVNTTEEDKITEIVKEKEEEIKNQPEFMNEFI